MGSFEDKHEGRVDDDEREASRAAAAGDAARRAEPTEEERAAFEEMLLEHDLEGARLQAMNYAMVLTRKNQTMARQMADDALTILWERCTWDPKKVKLGAYLVGVVRSEWSHAAEAGDAERRNYEDYLVELGTTGARSAASAEDVNLEHAEREDSEQEAVRELEEMRAHFEKARDTVNLSWIQFMLDGIEEPAEMAKRSHRPVEDFYRAADRRTRLVRKLRARKRGEDE